MAAKKLTWFTISRQNREAERERKVPSNQTIINDTKCGTDLNIQSLYKDTATITTKKNQQAE